MKILGQHGKIFFDKPVFQKKILLFIISFQNFWSIFEKQGQYGKISSVLIDETHRQL